MLKRSMVAITTACIMFICMLLPVSAAEADEPGFSLMAANYRKASASISISDNGTASATGKMVGTAGHTTKISIHLYLQKYSSGKWTSVADWTGSKAASSYTLKKTKNVAKGCKYRTKAVLKAYAGSSAEKTTKYSTAVKY